MNLWILEDVDKKHKTNIMRDIKIVTLNELTDICGFFNNESIVNNGFGCKHKACEDKVLVHDKTLEEQSYESIPYLIARSFSKCKINKKRVLKKFINKARGLSEKEQEVILNMLGYYFHGRCFSFSCPISWEVDFDSINQYENAIDFDDIKTAEDMPCGFGDELMGIEV
jgi:hypothetical protein